MAKAVKYSAMASEIKKEYLREHLESTKKIIEDWISELNAPSPFGPHKGIWGWQAAYRSSIEQDPDSNHILRRHVRSRALWHHHADWERKLDSIWQMKSQVCKDADKKHSQQLIKKRRKYTENYIPTALWQGFGIACGSNINIDYKIPDDQKGITYGAFNIERSVKSNNDRDLVEQEHREFSQYIAGIKTMKELFQVWNEVKDVQGNMRTIATMALKSSDILYPCRFCKHLWK